MQSRFFIKTLIYAFNRKKLVDVFRELNNRKLQKRVFTAIYSKTKFRLSQKKIYLSQLLNNRYCIDFLLHISYIIFKDKYTIQQKAYLKLNFDKLLIKQKLNNAKNVFAKLIKATKIIRNENRKVSDKLEKVKLYQAYLLKRKFFQMMRSDLGMVKEILKFQKRLFLLRYYYNKFKREKLSSKIKKAKSTFKAFILKRVIALFKPKYRKVNIDSNNSFKLKIKRRLFKILKIFTNLSFAKQYIIKQRVFYSKLHFFKTMRIVLIESLLTQGLINKVQDFKRKETLGILLKTSLKRKKLDLHQHEKDKLLKRKAFYLLKNVKNIINELITRYIRFIFHCFIKMALYKKYSRKDLKNTNQRLNTIYYFRSFFAKIKRSLNNSIVNQSKQSIQSMQAVPDKLKLYFSLFLNKVKAIVHNKKSRLINIRYLRFKSFIGKVNKRVQVKCLQKAAKRFILFKNAKFMIHRITNLMDTNYKYIKLKKFIKAYHCDRLYQSLEYCYKTKGLEEQIELYYNLKVKKKVVRVLKYYYSSKLKYHLIERRYKDYLIITTLKNLTSYIIKHNNN
jgi:hypothetical protein